MNAGKSSTSILVTDACHKHGGFYLGSIGGPAAVLAQGSIKSLECVEYPELGMEAIWKIEVEDLGLTSRKHIHQAFLPDLRSRSGDL